VAPVEVAFHTGVADKLPYACRLLRKAWRSGARVAVSGEPAELQRLDQALWTFEPLEFVPHRRLRRDEEVPAALQRTPIWLLDPGAAAPPGCDVLVNLGPERRMGDDAYRRIVELVSSDPAEAQAGRRRWKQYETEGWSIVHHPQGQQAAR
jgi:DNA polymerase-3 subunit chi